MNALVRFIVDAVQTQFGVPGAMRRALANCSVFTGPPLEPPRTIDADSVVRWTDLGDDFHTWPRKERGHLMGWRWAAGHYDSITIHRAEYAALEVATVVDGWHCDISELDGFTSSKSTLSKFRSTDEMVETNSKEMIDRIDAAKLDENLAHKEIRILHTENPSDHFMRFAWDGRLFLSNSGGSHHLAAAKYIAKRLNVKVDLCARLYTYSLDTQAVRTLCSDFEMVVIDDSPTVWLKIMDELRAFRATWFHHKLPRQAGWHRVILLPRAEPRSVAASSELRRAGALSLNEHLLGLLARQSKQLENWGRTVLV